jgi:hypothetical protein
MPKQSRELEQLFRQWQRVVSRAAALHELIAATRAGPVSAMGLAAQLDEAEASMRAAHAEAAALRARIESLDKGATATEATWP